MHHTCGISSGLVGFALAMMAGCASTTPSVGPCQNLQVQDADDKVLAVCWSDESTVVAAVNQANVLGTLAPTAEALIKAFAAERDKLPVRGLGESRQDGGYSYRLSHPATVQGRSQYVLEVRPPAPVAADTIQGPVKVVVEFIRGRYPAAPAVHLDLLPVSANEIDGARFEFARWQLEKVAIEQYITKP